MPAETVTSADAELSPLLLTVPNVAAQALPSTIGRAAPLAMLSRGSSACAQVLRAVFHPHIPWHSWQVQLGILAICLILVSGASLLLATLQDLPAPTSDLTVTREYPDSGKTRAAKPSKVAKANLSKTVQHANATDESMTGSTSTALATDDDLTPATVNSASYQAPAPARAGVWLEGTIEVE